MNIYQDKIQEYNTTIQRLNKVLSKLSTLRFITFIFLAFLLFILANGRFLAILLIVGPLGVLGFILLIKRYNQVVALKQHAALLKKINEEEILKQENKLTGFPAGQTFSNPDHPYTADLDIFGAHSLFQLLDRTTTEAGHLRLAEWLSNPASNETILKRQQAIQELTPQLAWRQYFQASGIPYQNPKSDYHQLVAWIEKPVQLLPRRSRYIAAQIILSLLSNAAAAYYLIHYFTDDTGLHHLPLLFILVVNILLIRKLKPIAEEIIDSTHQNIKILAGYQSLIQQIESGKFSSEILTTLQSTLRHHTYSAANQINKLKKILATFQLKGTQKSRLGGNKFYTIINLFWLLDIYWIIQTEKWKVRNHSYLQSWISAVSEFEVLSSLAGFAYSNPSFTFPRITEAPYLIHFEKMGHPLISPAKRICNNFQLSGRGKIAMITGSNMAGKSTFSRTVGMNLVLALIGAPCCAQSGLVSNMQLFTSMRTQDNLEEGVSSFYAELKRIEKLLDLVERGQPLFFLLDEVFKGTNSQDRYKGGVSLIQQLSELNAFGIISTHDLELAKLAANRKAVVNYSFNSQIQEGEMIFNYTLVEGICRDFNASELMKRSGVKLLTNIQELPFPPY